MRLGIICGDRLRHLFFANTLIARFGAELFVIQRREYEPVCSKFLCREDKKLFDAHFALREKKEIEYFSPLGQKLGETGGKVAFVKSEKELNSDWVAKLVEDAKLDVLFTFGVGLLGKDMLYACPCNTINLHGGLSPWFRGCATLFWPFYFMVPQYAGFTFHFVEQGVDSGRIVDQGCPDVFVGDCIHDVGCRTIVNATYAAVALVDLLKSGKRLDGVEQRGFGKLFLKSDFKPRHLRVVNRLFEEGFLKEYLGNPTAFPKPVLVSQFGKGVLKASWR